jgi:Ca-activated chloride channel homolog
MKRLLIVGIVIFGLVSLGLAQSGRRIKNPIPGTTSSGTTASGTAPTQSTSPEEETKAEPETVGYSESATNQPISISLSRRNREENKKSKEKSDKVQPTPTPLPTSTESDEEIIKVETNLISIPVTVSNRNNLYIPSLSKQNFQIFEDGKEQEIAYFGSTDKPFTAILLIDVSGSTSLKIEQIQDGAIAFVNQMLPQDKVMVISFDSGVHTLLEFSNDKAALEKAIRKAKFGGGTSLYDAVDNTLRKKMDKIEGKKAIVLFTDGVDTTSRRTYEATVALAVESEATIFPIYINTFLDSIGIGGGNGPMTTPPTLGIPGIGGGTQSIGGTRAEYALGRRYLQDLANATGGRIYRAGNSASELNAAFEGIAEELRSQYEIGYYPNSAGKSGDRKQIKVRINRPNLIIRTRDSYIVK